MKRFDAHGICLFGGHKGTHAAKLPRGWTIWAKSNVEGFSEALEAAMAAPPPSPKSRPAGRRYIIHKIKRCYTP